MRQKKLFYKSKTSIFIIIFYFILIGCGVPDNTAETEFKSIAKNLVKLILTLEKIPVEKETFNNSHAVRIHTSKQAKFINKTKSKWERRVEELEKYIHNHPHERWADDAILCLAFEYLSISKEENPFTSEALKAYQNLLKQSDIKIEPWTRKQFKKTSLGLLFSKNIPDQEWMKNLTEEERLKVYFQQALVVEFLKIDNYQKAELQYQKLTKDPMVKQENLKIIRNLIDSWKKHKEEYRDLRIK